jgi:hypothetical protein
MGSWKTHQTLEDVTTVKMFMVEVSQSEHNKNSLLLEKEPHNTVMGPAHHHNQSHFEMNNTDEATMVSSVNETISSPDVDDAVLVCESTSPH